ncbi:sensor histidine kinase [Oricola cellulosilytica]|uniref:histidine kinase n=1 Tax=Oricola cellulosilytica TaxID=1429082 RepID=A0A4R0PD43_9HYPH|nr:PAS domain-containing sensor histidine kinase [Oricola cellulosilytica]TCD14125.1 PAS domain S-box protein [Oricola cellulosilytica]
MDRTDHSLEFLDNIGIPAFVIDVERDGGLRYVMINAAHTQVTGLTNAVLAGKTPEELLPERVAETVTENYRRCIDSGECYTYEECLNLPETTLWWQTTLSPFFTNGRVSRLVGFAINVTERKETEFELSKSYHRIKRLNDEIDAVASTAAHDLRGPLRQISIVSEVLMQDFNDLGDGKLELLQTVSGMTSKALKQIDEVLSYQRQLGMGEVALSDCDLSRICADIVALLDPMGDKQIDFPKSVVMTDRPALQLVLRNLFDNALKHCRTKVALTLAPDSEPGWIKFIMSDDGCGFDPKDFPAGSAPGSNGCPPTGGFGLAAVRKITEARGGAVAVEEPVFGKGATISVTFRGERA